MLFSMRVLGVHVQAGVMYFGVVEPSTSDELLGSPVLSTSARLLPNKSLPPSDRAGDVYSRLAQDLRAIKPDVVAMLETRKYTDWKYSDAFDRIFLITVLQLACHELGIRYEDVKTEPVGRFVKRPAKDLKLLEFTAFGLPKSPTYWTTGRAKAFAVAATVAAGWANDG